MSGGMFPKIRPVQAGIDHQNGQSILVLSDPLGISENAVALPTDLTPLLNLCDGTRDIPTLKTAMELRTGIYLDTDYLERLFSILDSALLLESERFVEARRIAIENFRAAPSRSPIMIGTSYLENPLWLERSFQENIERLPPKQKTSSQVQHVRGLVSPHIDFQRGGLTYAEVWQRATESAQSAEVAIILGTNHLSGDNLVTLTKQHYSTPWGVMHTDGDVVDALVGALGEEVFADEFNHFKEHSVEAAATWLHYLTKNSNSKCKLVPIICGSLQKFIEDARLPSEDEYISCLIDTLKKATANKRTLIVAAGDLAHIGPAFGDSYAIGLKEKSHLTDADNELMSLITNGDADGMFQLVKGEKDRRRICGLSPIYLTLRLLGETKGEITGYAQCPADSQSSSFVSICGIVFS